MYAREARGLADRIAILHKMALTIDFAATARRLSEDEFAAWAQGQTVFLSSVMGELASERRALAEHLERLGLTVRWFEEFGGRDDSAEAAYLSEVRASTLYVGLLADSYGTMLSSEPYAGFSATHAEYLEAQTQGKRISFWARMPADNRDGHARTFLTEVQLFRVTGSFTGSEDLADKVERRLREIASEDLAPWVKLGDTMIRAGHVEVGTDSIAIEARVHDPSVLRALAETAGDPQGWGGRDIPITYANRSGIGRIKTLSEVTTSAAFTDATIRAKTSWARGVDSMAAGTAGYSREDLTEIAVKVGLLGEKMPGELGRMSFLVGASDALAELQIMQVPEGAVQPLARLLVVEQLVGGRRASAIERFAIGPARRGERQIELSWWEPRGNTNVEPSIRSVNGKRRWG
jgi:hypothetical protein